MPQMAKQARTIMKDGVSPRSDSDAVLADVASADRTCSSFMDFAAKIIGVSISPRLDFTDDAYVEVFDALEDSGFFDPGEMQMMERETPMLRTSWGWYTPKEIRAKALAEFINGRRDEGTLGENLPGEVRRTFERFNDMFSALRTLGQRSGFSHAGAMFLPAYRGQALRELAPTEPGEIIRPGPNRNKLN